MSTKFLNWFVPITLGTLLCSSGASAGGTYHVVTNTSSLSGQAGFLDFQFAKGNAFDSLNATVTLSNIITDGTLDPNSSLSGDASGVLPATGIVSNTGGFNDLFQGLIFGQNFSFDVTFSGDALNSALPSSYGSTFAFSLFASDGATPLLTTDPNGTVLDININPGAQLSAVTFPSVSGAGPAVTTTLPAVPELASSTSLTVLLVLGAGLAAVGRRRRRYHG